MSRVLEEVPPPTVSPSASKGWDRTDAPDRMRRQLSQRTLVQASPMLSQEALYLGPTLEQAGKEAKDSLHKSTSSLFLIGTNPEELILRLGDGDI